MLAGQRERRAARRDRVPGRSLPCRMIPGIGQPVGQAGRHLAGCVCLQVQVVTVIGVPLEVRDQSVVWKVFGSTVPVVVT